MTVTLNDAAITDFFNRRGGEMEELLTGYAESVRAEAVREADLVLQNKFDTSTVIDVAILEGPLRAAVGIFDQLGRVGRFLGFKAQEETGWLNRAVAKARDA